MHSIELKVLNQSLLLNVADGKEQYYRDVASELDRLMGEFLQKSQLRSDIKVAVSVAYKLMLENKELKDRLLSYESIENKVDELLVKVNKGL